MRSCAYALLGALVLLGGCDEQSPPQESSTPSPLADFDKDRLWILAKASPVGEGRRCAKFYREPEDPRYKPRAQECEAWSLDFVDYLRLNGLPALEPAHVRDLVYWDWFYAKSSDVVDCMKMVSERKVGAGIGDAEARRQKTYDHAACDPYTHATQNQKQTPEDLGIVFHAN